MTPEEWRAEGTAIWVIEQTPKGSYVLWLRCRGFYDPETESTELMDGHVYARVAGCGPKGLRELRRRITEALK